MDAVIAKVITIIVLLVITLLLGIIPYFIIKRGGDTGTSRVRERILGFLNCFAGGVFLGTCFLHLFVEGKEDLEDVLEEKYNFTGYPVFETIVGSGFFLIALLEQIAVMCMAGIVVKSSSTPLFVKRDEKTHLLDNGHSNYRAAKDNDFDAVMRGRNTNGSNASQLERSISHTHEIETVTKASGLRAFLLLIALSFHTIFDGLAVGLQMTDTDVWEVFAAISIHKILVAFCLGLQLFRAFQPHFKKAFGCLLLFSLMSPIGIGIGIAVTSSHRDQDTRKLVSGTLQGIACGTFLFVTCFEILREELAHKSSILKVFVAAIGFGAMAGVKVLDHD